MKIVWLCAFANDEIAQITGVQGKPMFAPWITELIKLFRKTQDIELHIVSPNYYNNTAHDFYIGRINVHLFQYMPKFLPQVAHNLSYNYSISRRSVRKIVETVQPDLIQLYGSENSYYASAVLGLKDRYPLLVTVQGFVHLSSVPKNFISKYIRWNRIRIERKINEKAKFMSCGTSNSLGILNKINPTAVKYNNLFPTTTPEVSADDFPEKEYDLVYFARIAKDKGIEDFIKVVEIIKKSKPTIKAIVIGGGNKNYVAWLKEIILKKQIEKQIAFAGFLPTQQDVFKLAAKGKVYVLPTYFDGIPGSIREAMFMKLPVVAYAVGGIPTFNDSKECIALVEKQNIPQLVEKITRVLNDAIYREELVKNAYELIEDKFDNKKIYKNLLKIYNDILQSDKA